MSEYKGVSDTDLVKRLRAECHHQRSADQADLSRSRAPFYDRISNFPFVIKAAAARDLRECRWSREQVAEGLSRLAGHEITVAQIDAYVSQTHKHKFPAELVPAWVRVTGSRRLLDLLCAEAGFWVADETDQAFSELGRAGIEQEKLNQRVSSLKRELWDKV